VTEAARVVVFAVGNPSRGDDALGPRLLERIVDAYPGLATVSDFQLQVEHALDLKDADLALFIDAAVNLDGPYRLFELEARGTVPVFSHALSPQAVLAVHRSVEGSVPPPSFMLAVRGQDFELGSPLSAVASDALESAWILIRELLSAPAPERWRRSASANPAGARPESIACQALSAAGNRIAR
jgi:hydrogenase maturation protease